MINDFVRQLKMEKLTNDESIKWKIRRGVNLSFLLPPFMWLRSRPRSTVTNLPTTISTIKEKIISHENYVGSEQKFVLPNIRLGARLSVDSIAKTSKSSDNGEGKNFSEISRPILTRGSRTFRSLKDEKWTKESTDPTVSHVLTIPYDEIPPVRYYNGDGTNTEYDPLTLLKRPRSPVRNTLANKFDYEVSREKLSELLKKRAAMDYLKESTARMSDIIKLRYYDIPCENGETRLPLILKVIHEEVTLTNACESLGIDIEAFIDTSIAWAILAIETNGRERVHAKEINEVPRSGAFFKVQRLGDERTDDTVTPSFSASIRNSALFFHGSTVHRSLSWDLLCPAHEYARIVESYHDLADCIDERILDGREDTEKVARVPDLSCYHFHEI